MRTATITRNTSETQITVPINLDGTGKARLDAPCAWRWNTMSAWQVKCHQPKEL
ncbi:nickel transporter [Kingella kingae]|nr:nickel transporter [Kingella kingae]MDK4564539.1 nickel transporter [Kingella kingae]MDK4578849.1 nickel transporter [Kingella kingae]MDK4609259.1 nickel transporter [Kingella kingae]MDK4627214.1 nickel transporter [Kingella kingae]MDK4674969.1 nickel transporter [Kingella kingae]